MATYAELYALRQDSDLQDKIAVAVVIAAEGKLSGTPSAAEATWARSVVQNPGGTAQAVTNLVLAANKSASSAVILAATDAAIQSIVDAVVDGLILGEG